MMDKNNDILESEELRREPFSVPDGYFDNFRKNMKPWESGKPYSSADGNNVVKTGPLRRIMPYVALAAMFAAIAFFGQAVLKNIGTDTDSEYGELIFADLIPLTEPDLIYHADESEDAGISGQDVVDYLIYSGISIEDIR